MNVSKVFLLPASVRPLCVNLRDLRETILETTPSPSLSLPVLQQTKFPVTCPIA